MIRELNSLMLLTDFYQFTMAACYYKQKMFAPSTFSLFIRNYGPNRGYYVSAGVETALSLLESFRYNQEELAFLSQLDLFDDDFLHFLSGLRFTGEVHAIPEGRLFFVDEPVLEVTAPLVAAQLVETLLLNSVNLEVTIATKAARCFYAARGRNLVDFSLRRTHGIDAGLRAARASYITGFAATSNTLAGKLYGIPVTGTMAHSFVTSFSDETAALRAFVKTFPNDAVLLIDTYDTIAGARKALALAKQLEEHGGKLRGVRIDRGDIVKLSKEVKRIFAEAEMDVSVLASGGFDEYLIEEAVLNGAEVDAFGVGAKMGVSQDHPFTSMTYKLVEYDGKPITRLSPHKQSLGGKKQVRRVIDDGRMLEDILCGRDEQIHGEVLLEPVMLKGRRLRPSEPLSITRSRFKAEYEHLPEQYKSLRKPASYPVRLSPLLEAQLHAPQAVKPVQRTA